MCHMQFEWLWRKFNQVDQERMWFSQKFRWSKRKNLKFNNCGESFVHGDCRKNYVSKHKIAQFKKQQQSATTTTDCDSDRSRKSLNQHCIFCGFKLSLNKDKENICVIKTTAFQESIVQICHERNDEWATEVLNKMEAIP